MTTNALRSLEYWLVQYRRSWRGTVVSSVLTPLLYLMALGWGVGSMADERATASLGDLHYLDYVAPGLLAAMAVQTAVTEATHPVMAAMRWHKAYHAMRNTPLGITDLLAGHLAFMALRILAVSVVFTGFMACFGAIGSPWWPLAVPAALLTGMACAVCFTAYSAWVERDASLTLVARFVVLPMFLLCGVLYPVTLQPAAIRAIVYTTPLWHGAQLCRGFTVGRLTAAAVVTHVAVLTAWLLGGFLLARGVYRRRLAA